ncbi:CoA transferase, partial [Variovorax sp. KK3]
IAAGEQAMWKRLCDALGADDLLNLPPYATEDARSVNRVDLNQELSGRTRQRTTAEWMAIFERGSVAAGPINRMDDVFNDAQVRHLGVAQPMHHPALGPVKVVGQPFKLSRTPSEVRHPVSDRGANTEEILETIGYTGEDIAALREEGVI